MRAPESPQWETITDDLVGTAHVILRGDGFYVSYAPHPGGFVHFWQSDTGGDETALVRRGGYLILNGDYRREYAALIPQGYTACKAFYDAHPEAQSSWSTNEEATDARASLRD